MANRIDFPEPATNAELRAAIEGYRCQLDAFAKQALDNLEWLRDSLDARRDPAGP